MSDTQDSMFAREVDFKLETTENSYVACRALSVRARHINRRGRELAESTEMTQPNPTVGAFVEYSTGRLVATRPEGEGREEEDTQETQGPGASPSE